MSQTASRENIQDLKVRIRPATEEDFNVLRYLEEQIFPEDPWTEGMIREELSLSARAYFIAEKVIVTDCGGVSGREERTTVVGYAGMTLGLDADVMTVGVMPDSRRSGVGACLVEAMLAAGRQHNVERVFLEVRESNTGAQRLYEKYGFERIGRVRAYFRNPVEDAVTMRLNVLSEIDVT